MKLLFAAVFVLSISALLVSGFPTSSQSESSSSIVTTKWKNSNACSSSTNNNVSVSTCLVTALWEARVNSDCTVSEYYKKTETPSTDPLNGVAQCTKTPCGATEKVKVDCATAFGKKLSEIEN